MDLKTVVLCCVVLCCVVLCGETTGCLAVFRLGIHVVYLQDNVRNIM
jgi:hypothetical protein